MKPINEEMFALLLKSAHENPGGVFELRDSKGQTVTATYDTDYETDNGLDVSEPGYKEFQGIAFRRTDNGALFEVNCQQIPVSAKCDGRAVY